MMWKLKECLFGLKQSPKMWDGILAVRDEKGMSASVLMTSTGDVAQIVGVAQMIGMAQSREMVQSLKRGRI